MAADLTSLEQAAARVGLPGLKARVVPHDKRRGWWFRWGGGELLVSDRVIDRCPPEDACALLMEEIERVRGLRRALLKALGFIGVGLLFIGIALRTGGVAALGVYAGGLMLAWGSIRFVIDQARAAEGADDATVRRLGDATPLVRGLNEMDFEEIHLGKKVLPARPDLHRRAERLVAKHRLCDAPPE